MEVDDYRKVGGGGMMTWSVEAKPEVSRLVDHDIRALKSFDWFRYWRHFEVQEIDESPIEDTIGSPTNVYQKGEAIDEEPDIPWKVRQCSGHYCSYEDKLPAVPNKDIFIFFRKIYLYICYFVYIYMT